MNTDSQAALITLASHSYVSKIVWECYNTLKTSAKANKLILTWVPRHISVAGNVGVDKCAKKLIYPLWDQNNRAAFPIASDEKLSLTDSRLATAYSMHT